MCARTVSGGSDNGSDTSSYDFENRLVSLAKGTVGSAGTYNYTYDYRSRRVVRDESQAGGVVTDLVYSGGTSVEEYSGSINQSNLQVEYVRGSDYGGGVGGILYTIRSGTPSYTHENRRGDVVAKTDESGNLTFQSQYEAFGKQVATSGSTLDRQKSNSKDTDPTGLVDEGFRYRDLETGEFITRDPMGFVDGPNLYTYVVQNPWTHDDPEGLFVPGVGLLISAGFEISDTARYLTGYSSAKEYGLDSALNVASAVADLSDGETGFVDAGAQTAGRLAIKASLKSLAVGGVDAAGHAGVATVNAMSAAGGSSSGTGDGTGKGSSSQGCSPEGSAKTPEAQSPQDRGRESEQRVLKDTGNVKNNETHSTSEGDTIPDFVNDKEVGDVKDTKTLSNTKQMKAQREVAQTHGKDHAVYTGQNTKVSKPMQNSGTKVVPRKDLGPQQQLQSH